MHPSEGKGKRDEGGREDILQVYRHFGLRHANLRIKGSTGRGCCPVSSWTKDPRRTSTVLDNVYMHIFAQSRKGQKLTLAL